MNVSSQVEMLDSLIPNVFVSRARHLFGPFHCLGLTGLLIDFCEISDRQG
jgi:hypothetical protein